MFVLLSTHSLTQKDSNRFVRFSLSKFSVKVAEKYSALLVPYLFFSLLIAHSRKIFHSAGELNFEVISRISHTFVDGLKIIIEYIAGVTV
jgi:hypothetical protein